MDDVLDRGLAFLEECFGEGQELFVFLSDLTRSPDIGKYFQSCPHPRYEAHRKLLMVQEQEERLRRQLEKFSFTNPVRE